MREDKKFNLEFGDVVQISPGKHKEGPWAGQLMIVTEQRPWGAIGYFQIPVGVRQRPRREYYHAQWKEMEFIGKAHFAPKDAIQ
jgi:hypothetical protein